MRLHRSAHPLAVVFALAALSGAARADDVRPEILPTAGALGFESIRLPQGERLGLVSGSLLFDVGGNWGVGPAVYGAATGGRGGFFVGGVEVQHRWDLGSGFSLATGLYAGGGGGAAAPVGHGLMLRPSVTVLKDIGPTFQLGLAWSSVRFPSGDIRSNQLGLVLGWRQEFRYLSGSGSLTNATTLPSAGLGFDRISAMVTTYDLRDGSGRHLSLVGARADRRTSIDGVIWGMETSAAAKGDAAGYMEILGTASYSITPLASVAPTWRVGVRGSAGIGGGGGMPTGGGSVGKAAVTTEWSPMPGWTLGAEYGAVTSRGSFRARQAQVWLGVDLEPSLDGRGDAGARVVRTEWVGSWQHHTRVTRRDGSHQSLDTIGLALNRYLGQHIYITGQAHSAFAGSAGAYSVGLVGLGASAQPLPTLRVGAEFLGGAAGGGGVATAGGAVLQGLAWGAWQPGKVGEIRFGVGATRPLHNGRAGPVFELAWSRAFGMAGR